MAGYVYVSASKSTDNNKKERIDFQRDPTSRNNHTFQCHLFVFSVVLIITLLTSTSFSNLHLRGNSGQKLQNHSKLPRIHVELFCNANEKSLP